MKKTEPKYRHTITLGEAEEKRVEKLACGIMPIFRAGIEAKEKEAKK